jgi:hypothetical protein
MACKSDTPKAIDNTELNAEPTEISDSEKHLQNISRAHNASKFIEESQVRFKLKFNIKEEVFFDGFVTLKTDGSQARFLDSTINKLIESNNLKTELDKKLYWIVELYAMGFWPNTEDFNKTNSDNDDFIKATYNSPITSSTYTIYTHPLTDIVQYVEYDTDILDEPFEIGTLFYDKYITVNRIPVSLNWNIKFEDNTVAKAEITRISYPKTF